LVVAVEETVEAIASVAASAARQTSAARRATVKPAYRVSRLLKAAASGAAVSAVAADVTVAAWLDRGLADGIAAGRCRLRICLRSAIC
jgi:hypothetical protein